MKSNLMLSIRRNQDRISLSFVVLFFLFITILIIWINSNTNFLGKSYRDVYLYLIFALRLSGVSFGAYTYVNNLSPLVPFLTSLLFRLGFVNVSSIFIVSGVFYFIGTVFFYKLLRLRFNNLYSVLGGIIYGLSTINLLWAANGTIDIPSVSLSIVAVYALIMAIDRNQKYFYLAFPMIVLSFFAKYTAIITFAVMCVYYVLRIFSLRKLKRYIKNTAGGIIFGLLFTIPYFIYIFKNNLSLGFLSQAGEVASEPGKVSTLSHAPVNDIWFYLTDIPHCLNSHDMFLAYLLIGIFVLGFVIAVYKSGRIFKKTYNQQSILLFKHNISLSIVYKLVYIDVILLILVFLTVGTISVVYSEILMFIVIYVLAVKLNKIIGKYNRIPLSKKYKHLNFDILMFMWFFAYFIFFSSHITKADRYFTTMAPGFIALTVLALELILSTSKIRSRSFDLKENKRKDYNIKLSTIIILILMVVFICSGLHFISIDKTDPLVDEEAHMSQYLQDNYPDYINTTVSADRGPIYVWYLHKEVKYMKLSNNSSVLDYNLKKDNVNYYIGNNSSLTIEGYEKIHNFGNVTLYKKEDSEEFI